MKKISFILFISFCLLSCGSQPDDKKSNRTTKTTTAPDNPKKTTQSSYRSPSRSHSRRSSNSRKKYSIRVCSLPKDGGYCDTYKDILEYINDQPYGTPEDAKPCDSDQIKYCKSCWQGVLTHSVDGDETWCE